MANGAGLPTTALMTDMNQPLASAAGNAVEVANAVDFLTGRARDRRLEEVTLALAAEMLLAAGIASTHRQADSLAGNALSSGRAADVFGRMVSALGGPAAFVDKYETYLPQAPVIRPVKSGKSGFVTAIASRDVGIAVVALGGGRTKPEDVIDHAVGITGLVPVGTDIGKGDALAIVHARNEADADQAEAAVRSAYTLGEVRPRMPRPVIRRIALSA